MYTETSLGLERTAQRRFIDLLFRLGIFLLPYDAIRHILPSTYRPISVYFFFLYLLFFILYAFRSRTKVKVHVATLYLVLFIGYNIVSSLILNLVYQYDIALYWESLTTLAIGVITFFSCSIAFSQIAERRNVTEYCDEIFGLIGTAYVIPLVVGVIDALVIYGPLPMAIKNVITLIFGGNQATRMTGVTFEASWLSMHMAFAFGVYLYLAVRNKKKYKIRCILSALLFFLSASLQGILTVILGVILFGLVYGYVQGKFLKMLRMFILIVLGSVILFFLFRWFLSLLPTSYFTTRILNFTSIDQLLKTDGSTFLRTQYPIIGLLMFRDHFLFGMGGGSFAYAMGDYIQQYYPWASSFPEVALHMSTRNTASAVSLYTRVLGENGLIGGILFYTFIGKALAAGKRILQFPYVKYVLFWLCISLGQVFQFSSYALTLFWVPLAFMLNLPTSTSKEDAV